MASFLGMAIVKTKAAASGPWYLRSISAACVTS